MANLNYIKEDLNLIKRKIEASLSQIDAIHSEYFNKFGSAVEKTDPDIYFHIKLVQEKVNDLLIKSYIVDDYMAGLEQEVKNSKGLV